MQMTNVSDEHVIRQGDKANAADAAPVSGGFKVDITRGGHNGAVSSQWFSRPDDQRFLNLDDLYAATRKRADGAHVRTVRTNEVAVQAVSSDAE